MAAVGAQSSANCGAHSAPGALLPGAGAAMAQGLRQARRSRQVAARDAAEGKLIAAHSRIKTLEKELQEARAQQDAAAAQAATLATGSSGQSLSKEIAERLALIAPSLEAGLANEADKGGAIDMASGAGQHQQHQRLAARRRNAAAHAFGVAASRIARAGARSLNRIQRGSSGHQVRQPARHRPVPAMRAPVEKVAAEWTVARRGVRVCPTV